MFDNIHHTILYLTNIEGSYMFDNIYHTILYLTNMEGELIHFL